MFTLTQPPPPPPLYPVSQLEEHKKELEEQKKLLEMQNAAAAAAAAEAAAAADMPAVKQQWWKSLPPSQVDPISLEPLSELEYPPFQLCSTDPSKASADASIHYFDGAVLAYFLVSQMNFIDPLNRRELLEMELVSLDNYLMSFDLGQANGMEAYKSNKANKEAQGGDHHHSTRAEYLQHEVRDGDGMN